MNYNTITQVYVFGDQTLSFEAGVVRLLHNKGNPVLTSFLERVSHALRLEIGDLPAPYKQLLPNFTTLTELLARYREREFGPNPAIESAFTCVHQLGCFISYFSEVNKPYPRPEETHLLGFCTGLLSAIAIGTSHSVTDLLPVAVEIVLVAFRIGLCAMAARDLADEGADSGSSWALVVGLDRKEEMDAVLDEFCNIKEIPTISGPYISGINPTNVTISGSPSILDLLTQSLASLGHKTTKVPIYAPYHAPHLYKASDIDTILSKTPKEMLSLNSRFPIISSATGKSLESGNFQSLLRSAIRAILIEPLQWQSILKNWAAKVTRFISNDCIVYPIVAGVNVTQALSTAISQNGNNVKVNSDITILRETTLPPKPTGRPEQSKIAIVGYAGRFPEADDIEAFWELLRKGLDVHKEVPPDRFNVDTYYDPTGKARNKSTVRYGCWIRQPGLFDARFFNMSPREAADTCAGQRLAVTTAYEALEMAGFTSDKTPSSMRDRVGVFYGMTSDDWREVNSGQNIDTYFTPGGNRAFTPGRINYHFKFKGPSLSIDTACSSSAAALHAACNSLWRGDCDTAIAGGTNIMTNPDNFCGLDRGYFLSKKGNCNTFDDDADGYCRADGVATVILKRLEDAEADNDPIFAVIVGAYTNHSAEAISMTRPHAPAQAAIFRKILRETNIDPLDVSYIEMHGTGTQAGDAVEMDSVLSVFAPPHKHRPEDRPVYLGSAKANIGHQEATSGVTSLVKVLLMMDKNEIPPHAGIKNRINRNFPKDLAERNVHIAMKPVPWPLPQGGKRRVFVNNFSAAGGNSALLIEDPPMRAEVGHGQDPRTSHIVAISARSVPSLKKNIENLLTLIENTPETVPLPCLSYTLTARRIHHNRRIIVNGSTLQEIRERLKTCAKQDELFARPIPAVAPPVVFAFTGQGALYVGIGKQFYQDFSKFRIDIDRFDEIGKAFGFPSIVPLINGSLKESDVNKISPVLQQLGTTCVQMALVRLLSSWNIKPSAVIGHSLGEYAAFHIAGILSVRDTIYLCGKRAQLLEQSCKVGTHTMLVAKISCANLTPRLGGRGEIACVNSPENTVVSGPVEEIEELQRDLATKGIKCTGLNLPYAFHSKQVEPILEEFENIAKRVVYRKPTIAVISPLLGEVVAPGKPGVLDASYLAHACRGTVNFLEAIETAKQDKLIPNNTVWIEIGGHPVLCGMLRETLGPQATVLPVLNRNEDPWKTLTGTLGSIYMAGCDVEWREYHRDFKQCQRVLRLPAYSWDLKNYWIQYVNDWCLRKLDPWPPAESIQQPKVELPPKLSTSSVQRIVEEEFSPSKASLVIESDLSDPRLVGVVQGHKVNGTSLCPSSLYADIALTLGNYLLEQSSKKTHSTTMDVCNMVVEKPLIFQNKGKQLFRVSLSADWNLQKSEMKIFSVNTDGRKIADHGTCTIKFSDKDGEGWKKDWKRIEYLIKSRIDILQKGVEDGECHKVKRSMAYKLFASLVEYDEKYRGMAEVIMGPDHESTARVSLQPTENDMKFNFPPYWIDSLGHLSGFTMNASVETDSKTQVYINHGWDYMHYVKEFSSGKEYRTYVKMQNVGGTTFSGDVYIFEAGEIIAVFGGVKFQGVPRKLLDSVLPPASSVTTAKVPIAPKNPTHGHLVSDAAALVRKQKPKILQKSHQSSTASPVKQGQKPRPAGSPNITSKALAIIAEEIGVDVSQLTSETEFAPFGVDSLLSLTIIGRFREEMDLDVSSTLFFECPTVNELIEHLKAQDSSGSMDVDIPSPASRSTSTSSTRTPQTESDLDFTDDTSVDDDEVEDIMSIIQQTLAEEIGIDKDEIAQDTPLGDLGMDSLLSLTVLGALREKLDIEIPSDLLLGYCTLQTIEAALGIKPRPQLKSKNTKSMMTVPEKNLSLENEPTRNLNPIPSATSILLQGSPKTAKKYLFLFPDGSGSSTSYAAIPKISPDVAVYGLNCPYMKTPELLKGHNLSDLTVPYLTEVRRRQPKGPYHFGGWSAGGISAFDAAHAVMKDDEQVETLILFDCPFPVGIEKLPARLYDFFKSIGMFGGPGQKDPPSWLQPHFMAFLDALDKYNAIPFPSGGLEKTKRLPKTYIALAKDGVCKNPDDPRPERYPGDAKQMWWLLENRVDLGPNGWDTLVGGKEKIAEIMVMENTNHFTMFQEENGKKLAKFLQRALA